MNFGTVAILGPGLIGGSLALALAERGLAKRLMIYARSPRALDEIRTRRRRCRADRQSQRSRARSRRRHPLRAHRGDGRARARIPRRAQAHRARHRRRQRQRQRRPRPRAAARGSRALDRQPSHGRKRTGRVLPPPGPICLKEPPSLSRQQTKHIEKPKRLAEKFWEALGARLSYSSAGISRSRR